MHSDSADSSLSPRARGGRCPAQAGPQRSTLALIPWGAALALLSSACSSTPEASPTPETSTDTPATTASPDPSVTPDVTPTATPETALTATPAPEETPTPGPKPAGFAALIVSNYADARLSTVQLDSFQLGKDVLSVGGDTVSVLQASRLYLLERNFAAEDFIHIHQTDPDLTLLKTVSLGEGVVPQDLVVLNGKAYISLYKGKGLRILDPATGATLGSIDLSAYADADGDCEASRMLAHEGKLYVTLQRVDYTDSFNAKGPGMIAVIDPSSDTVEGVIETSLFNLHELYLGSDGAGYVSGIGLYGVADGGIERLNLEGRTSDGVILDDEALGSTDKSQFAVVGTRGYLPSGGDILELDLAAGTNLGALDVLSSESLNSVSADPLGRLWAASGTGVVWVIDPIEAIVLTPSGLDISRTDYSLYDTSFYLEPPAP